MPRAQQVLRAPGKAPPWRRPPLSPSPAERTPPPPTHPNHLRVSRSEGETHLPPNHNPTADPRPKAHLPAREAGGTLPSGACPQLTWRRRRLSRQTPAPSSSAGPAAAALLLSRPARSRAAAAASGEALLPSTKMVLPAQARRAPCVVPRFPLVSTGRGRRGGGGCLSPHSALSPAPRCGEEPAAPFGSTWFSPLRGKRVF